jgi:hypothetical protein
MNLVGDSSDQNVPAVLGTNTVANGRGVVGNSTSTSGTGVLGQAVGGDGVFGNSTGGRGVVGHSTNQAGVAGDSDQADGVTGVVNDKGGFAGFFGGDLSVTGSIKATGDICLVNADCAEDFDILGAEEIQPGTVMVINEEGALKASERAYDTRVAGVISGAGALKPGLILGRTTSPNQRVPIALLGKAYCKVDASPLPIQVGDLLTSSPTRGHAMKAVDPLQSFGAVIGKALKPLESGQGLIPILIALQ